MIAPGAQTATIIMPSMAPQLAGLRKRRDEIIAPARRRGDVLLAMLRGGTVYQPKSAPSP